MKTRLDMEKIAKGLGAECRRKVTTGGGYFGAMQLLADAFACRPAAAGIPIPRGPSGGSFPSPPRR